MDIYFAIDLRGGRVVRLTQGDYSRETVYADDPAAVAEDLLARGAKCLHVVDLDGARDGARANVAAIRRLAAIKGLFIEVGGGLRDERAIAETLDMGVSRVILGTIAVTNMQFAKRMIAKYGAAIAVGVDVRAGHVAIDGWRTVTRRKPFSFCAEMQLMGLKTAIVTDIASDGELKGPNLETYQSLCARLSLAIIASGGVTTLDDLRALKKSGVSGAIIGKALYTGALDIGDALRVAEESC